MSPHPTLAIVDDADNRHVADQTPKPVPPVEELEHAVVVGGRWRVRFTEDTRYSTPYDGEGFGATIEEALRAAIGDMYANLFEPGRDPQSIFTEMFGTEYGWIRPA